MGFVPDEEGMRCFPAGPAVVVEPGVLGCSGAALLAGDDHEYYMKTPWFGSIFRLLSSRVLSVLVYWGVEGSACYIWIGSFPQSVSVAVEIRSPVAIVLHHAPR